MKRFIEGENRSQTTLFPEQLEEYIAEENAVRVIDVFVDKLDLPELGFTGVGWSMKSTLAKEIVLDALLMAIWRRSPKQPVIIHSDQGSQYGSVEWQRFCKTHRLIPSMSRRGNCYDNAVIESFSAA